MMHIITASGCAWITVAAIISVHRSAAQAATIRLDDGQMIVSLERYEAFVERLNRALLKATEAEAPWAPDAIDVRPAPARPLSYGLGIPDIALDPVLP